MWWKVIKIALLTILLFIALCLSGPTLVSEELNVERKRATVRKSKTEGVGGDVRPSPTLALDYAEKASWYDQRNLLADHRLAIRGEHLGVAHLEIPLGTRVQLRSNRGTIHAIVCDRGPQRWTGRQWDLSKEAFAKLAPLSVGVIRVESKILK